MGAQSNFSQANSFIFKVIFAPTAGNCPNSVRYNMTTPYGTVTSGSGWTPVTCGSSYTLVQPNASYINSNTTINIWFDVEP